MSRCFAVAAAVKYLMPKSRKVVNLPPDKNMPEVKPFHETKENWHGIDVS